MACGTATSSRWSLSQPQHTVLCLSTLKSITFCLNMGGYVFIKLSWNSYSAYKFILCLPQEKTKKAKKKTNNKKKIKKNHHQSTKKNLHRQAIMRYSWLAVCPGTWFAAV